MSMARIIIMLSFFISVIALAAETPEESRHRVLAQDFVALHVDHNKLGGVFDNESISMVRTYEDRYYMHFKRKLRPSDKIVLAQFFREKLDQVISLEFLQRQLAEFVLKNTTYEELASINAFLQSPAGHKLYSLRSELSIVRPEQRITR